jgi:hypothetical protein
MGTEVAVARERRSAAFFVPVRASTPRNGSMCRMSHPSGWVIECSALPEAAWISALMRASDDAPT